MRAFRALQACLAAIAGAKVVVAVGRVLLGLAPGTLFTPLPVLLLHLVVPGLAGGVLLVFGRRDPRAAPLGVLFLLTASAFSDLAMAGAEGAIGTFLVRLQPIAFIPLYTWVFLHRFPVRTPFGLSLRVDRALRGVAAAFGVIWFLLEFAAWPLVDLGYGVGPGTVIDGLGRSSRGSLFWLMVWLLVLPGIPYGLRKLRLGGRRDRRRARVLLAGLVMGMAPSVLLLGAWSASSAVRGVLGRPELIPWWTALVHAGLLSIPLTAAWATLTRRALDVRLVIRQAVWYLLARQTAVALVAAPALLLGTVLYANRSQSLGTLMSGPAGLGSLALTALGVALFAARGRLFDAIDRRFFREEYDARLILGSLVEHVGEVDNMEQIVRLVRDEVDRALHPSLTEVFLPRGPHQFTPYGPGFPSLVMDPGVAARLAATDGPVHVPSGRIRGSESGLGESPARGGFSHLVPIRDDDGALRAVLALGEKRSDLPYTREDLLLLERVAAVAGARMKQFDRDVLAATSGSEPYARECTDCGAVAPHETMVCPTCGGRTVEAPLPAVLLGKIRVVERVGQGGMGVVYRGVDATLGRSVAVKTLMGGVGRDIARLRREARTMASVSHPNLAVIFGAESWRGVPVLLVEYLEEGTLRDRLHRDGPMPAEDAVALIRTLAGAVQALHTVGILHRDIKPSNVAFGRDGTPKLLDFGLARFAAGAVREALERVERRKGADPDELDVGELDATLTRTGALVGTALYLAPEALANRALEPVLDVWALCVLLFECVAGTHPFKAATPALSLIRIRNGPGPEPSTLPGDLPPDLRAFLLGSLEPSGPRPRTTRELVAALDGLQRST